MIVSHKNKNTFNAYLFIKKHNYIFVCGYIWSITLLKVYNSYQNLHLDINKKYLFGGTNWSENIDSINFKILIK
jgi:hypothetical protein